VRVPTNNCNSQRRHVCRVASAAAIACGARHIHATQ
jgi:hypothetical protein